MSHFTEEPRTRPVVVIGEGPVSLNDVVAVAEGRATVVLGAGPGLRLRVSAAFDAVERAIQAGERVYGVTTGFGQSCGTRVSPADSEQLSHNLVRYHGCGVGEPLPREHARAAMLCRLVCLSQGLSGVSFELLEALAALLNHDVTPVIPSIGSVGASGDLTPMSYVAAVLQGERTAWWRGREVPAREALAAAGIPVFGLRRKEALSIMNGTSVMTGIAALTVVRSLAVLDVATSASALALHALAGHADQYDALLVGAKPHPGSADVARQLRSLLAETGPVAESATDGTLQDPYSVRCVPQILGVTRDALTWIAAWVLNEVNSCNDNPLVDAEAGRVLRGGNFYGGHVAFAMDALKTALAAVADGADRRIALLVDPRANRDLPANLVSLTGPERALHHGFKALQITASALTAEALKNTMPAAVFSRSTESHNQDIVSMGTLAARDAWRQVMLVARTVAIELMVAIQGCELRGGLAARPRLGAVAESVRRLAPRLEDDRPMDADVEALAAAVLAGSIGARDEAAR